MKKITCKECNDSNTDLFFVQQADLMLFIFQCQSCQSTEEIAILNGHLHKFLAEQDRVYWFTHERHRPLLDSALQNFPLN